MSLASFKVPSKECTTPPDLIKLGFLFSISKNVGAASRQCRNNGKLKSSLNFNCISKYLK